MTLGQESGELSTEQILLYPADIDYGWVIKQYQILNQGEFRVLEVSDFGSQGLGLWKLAIINVSNWP